MVQNHAHRFVRNKYRVFLYGWNCIFTVRQPKFSPEATVLQLSLPSRNKTTRYFKHHYFCFTLISYFSNHYYT